MDKYSGSTMYVVWLHCRSRRPAFALRFGDRPDDRSLYTQADRGSIWADSAEEAIKKYEFWKR